MSPIPVTIVTGFLGAGKTTLVNRLLRDPDFAETAVLINEFGDIQIDHDLVADFSDDLIMTTTGCLCCTATSDISKSLMEILEKRESGAIGPFMRVIVETTGLMDPVPVVATFLTQPGYDFEGGPLGGKFVLTRVVTLFDIINGPKTLDNHDEALKQVALCDLVLLTKTDMARDPATLRDITEDRKRISAINPGATILDSHEDWPQIRELFLQAATYDLRDKAEDAIDWLSAERTHDHEHHHHDHSHSHDHHGHHHGRYHHDHDHTRHGDDIRSHVIIADQPISPVGFSVFLDMVKLIADVDLLRLKGLVALSDDPGRPLVVHGVQHLIHPIERLERWPSDNRQTKIVLIGRKLDVDALQTALKQFEATPQSDEII